MRNIISGQSLAPSEAPRAEKEKEQQERQPRPAALAHEKEKRQKEKARHAKGKPANRNVQQILAIDAEQKGKEKPVEKNELLLSMPHSQTLPLSFPVHYSV